MRIKTKNELLVINILTVLLIIIITFFPSNILRIILGLPLVLFFPGYTLITALLPRKGDLGGIERVALSFGLSIAVLPLIGLILNYTPWGIRLYPILFSITLFIMATSLIALFRWHRLPPERRFGISFNFPRWAGVSKLDKVLSIVLVVAILGALGTLIYVIATPKVGERFTEFYILGPEGKATDYATELRIGEDGRVIVGIVNREYRRVSYRVEIAIDGARSEEIGPIVLEHGEKWEGEASFTPTRIGDNQQVQFLLYEEGKSFFKEQLHLWINVKGPE